MLGRNEKILKGDEAGSENESESTEPAPAQILAEDVDKREESVKHFRMSDGTIQAAQYAATSP